MLKVVFFVILALTAVGLAGTRDDEGPLFRSVYLTLVNKTHKLPDNWEDKVQIDAVTNFFGEEVQIERKTHEQFQLLREDLNGRGINIGFGSAYCSTGVCQQLWEEYLNKYGEEYAADHCAAPGYSEHQTGLAIDIHVLKEGKLIGSRVVRVSDEDKQDFVKIIYGLLPKYGFILRYPEGKEDITGHTYEPWHLRYIDSPKIAKKIAKEGLTLEEYLGEY